MTTRRYDRPGFIYRLCNVPGCPQKHLAQGLCATHREQAASGSAFARQYQDKPSEETNLCVFVYETITGPAIYQCKKCGIHTDKPLSVECGLDREVTVDVGGTDRT